MAVRYQRMLDAVGGMTGLGSGPARAAAEATLTALARRLDDADRSRLLAALPTELVDDFPTSVGPRAPGAAGFVREVSLLARRPVEQARLRAQAVLAALAEQEPELVAGLHLPDEIEDLFAPPYAGGGVSGPLGHSPPLTDAEIDDALRGLPYWSGDSRGLVRTVELPQANLDRVLERIEMLRRDLGRGPRVHRGTGTAELTVLTHSAGAVTQLDVDLAARIDALVNEVGAGIGSPYPRTGR